MGKCSCGEPEPTTTWAQRVPLHRKAVHNAAIRVDDAARDLSDALSEKPEEREQNIIYAVEHLSRALAFLRPALDPKDFENATEALR